MRHIKTAATGPILSLLLLATPSSGFASSVDDCVQDRDPGLSLEACTALIGSGNFDGDQLASIHFNRANARQRLDDLEGALEDYAEAARLKPESAGYLVNMAATKKMMDRTDEAIADLGKALELAPGDPRVLYNRGVMLRAVGRNEDALADIDAALQVRPDYALALVMRGLIRYAAGETDAAQDWQSAFVNGGQRFALRVQLYLKDRGFYDETVMESTYTPQIEAALEACATDVSCF